MNRPFPRLVLKIERGGMMPGTRIPTGSNRAIYWEYPESTFDAIVRTTALLKSQRTNHNLVRITWIGVYQNGEAWKLFTRVPGERYIWHYDRQWLHGYKQRTAAVAILPKEVLDEATR